MNHIEEINAFVDKHATTFTDTADLLWDFPELRWKEFDAVERQIAIAREFGFSITHEAGGIPTAFFAESGSGGPVLAFLGEYDALAGLSQAAGSATCEPNPASESDSGHGCGHHLLGTGSLLAAAATAEYLRAHRLPGRVRYYGCPAEEAAAGKSFMVKAGVFADVDAALTWHPASFTATRQILTLAYAQVYFHYRGLASHAGGSPERGRSALDAVELLNVGTNFLREHMPDTARIHDAITDAGGASPNVVQAQASVYYIVRATTVAGMQELYDRVNKIAAGAALMTETELTVEFDGASANILPNDQLESTLHRNLALLGGVPFDENDQELAGEFAATVDSAQVSKERAAAGLPAEDGRLLHDEVPPPPALVPRRQITASTDVGDVSWVTRPCLSAVAALGTPMHSWQLVAQGKLPAAHKGMLHTAKALAATATELFRNPELLDQAQAEFRETVARTPYRSPIPDGVVAPPCRS